MIKKYKDFLKEVFPEFKRVKKATINAGFGCPNLATGGCAYCNNVSFAGQNNINNIINPGSLAYFQSYTNTYAPVEKLREVFTPVILNENVVGISIGTRPDCLGEAVVELLAELNKIKPVIVEIGVQTANNQTLKAINRNHSVQEVIDAAKRCKEAGLLITSHIIIGLPGETTDDFMNTANLIKECGFYAVKIHPLHIVKNTKFAEDYAKGNIELLSLEEYCKAAAKVISIVQPSVAIERVSAEAPSDLLIAPDWCGKREEIWKMILASLQIGN